MALNESQSILCRRCNRPVKLLFGTFDYNRQCSNEYFHYYQCTHCHLIFISPIPEKLADYYGKDYYEIPMNLDHLAKRSEIEQYKLDIVKRRKPGGRLLEIGSSYGSFAFLAKMSGYDVTCIEMDATCCAFINEVVNITAINASDAREALDSLGEFDIIVLWHVIEHLSEPWSLLKTLVQHVRKDGILVISSPNPESLQFRIFRNRWVHLDAPRHLQLIPLSVLIESIGSLGMREIDHFADDPGGLGWNTYGWRKSLENIGGRFLGKNFSIFGKVVSVLVKPFEKINLYGSTYTVTFRK